MMKFTGERMMPEYNQGDVVWAEHYTRYMFAAQFVKGKSVLDIACGSGYGSYYLASSGAKSVIGVDIAPETVEYAQAKYASPSVNYFVGNAEAIPVKDKDVTTVVSFETIEHLKSAANFLTEIKRVLTDGGLAIISTPNKAVFPSGNPFHLKEFELAEYTKLLQKYFTNVQIYYQDNWITNAILTEDDVKTGSLDKPVQTQPYKIVDGQPKKSLYAVALCSDGLLPTNVKSVSALYSFALGSHEWLRDLSVQKEAIEFKNNQLMAEKATLTDEVSRVKQEVVGKEEELQQIYRSKSWRLTQVFRKFFNLVRFKN